MAELEAQRAKIVESQSAVDRFKVIVRGGRWTHTHSGRAYDAVAAQANTQQAKLFCQRYELPVMQSFATARYGDSLSTQLASMWARKMETLCQFWVEEMRSASVEFPGRALVPYEEEEGIAELERSLPETAHARQRIQQIRALWPSLTRK